MSTTTTKKTPPSFEGGHDLFEYKFYSYNDLQEAAWQAFKHVKDDYTKKEKSIGLDKAGEKLLKKEFETYWNNKHD